jgi:negative regulator of replication initiation
MKSVELRDETYEALQSLAAERKLSPDELVAALLQDTRRATSRDLLLSFLESADFVSLSNATERYLSLLSWCARNHAGDFADFVSHQESGYRYLMLSRDEVLEVRAHNHARQIDGTQFWAVMTIDERTKRRFVRRLLEFVGYRDESVSAACRALGLTSDSRSSRLLGVA